MHGVMCLLFCRVTAWYIVAEQPLISRVLSKVRFSKDLDNLVTLTSLLNFGNNVQVQEGVSYDHLLHHGQ